MCPTMKKLKSWLMQLLKREINIPVRIFADCIHFRLSNQIYIESEKDVRDISNQIRQIEDSLKKDFGPEEEFATLEGQCFESRDHEYIYKLCPFDRTVQIPLSSSMETNLGK